MDYLNFEGPEAFLENSEGPEGVWDLIFVKHLKNGNKLKMRAWDVWGPSGISRKLSGPLDLVKVIN